MRAHEAGALHGQSRDRGPAWLREPEDVNALHPALWASNVTKLDGVIQVAGVSATEIAREFGTPAYVLDEADFRDRARLFKSAFAGADIFYAGKAFLCTEVARWIAEEGLGLDVTTGGELAVALNANFPTERIGFHGNNKSEAEIRRALEVGVGRIIIDSFIEIDRIAKIANELDVTVNVLIRVTAGVEAHTHEYISTAHEDQKFGLSITTGEAMEAVRKVLSEPRLNLLGLHSHIGSQIFDTEGFEVAARRVLRVYSEIDDEFDIQLPEIDLGGGFGIAYTSQDDPSTPMDLALGLENIVKDECAALGLEVPKLSIEPGRAIVGPAMFTLYEAGTVKPVAIDGGETRTYVSVDGGMSDNVRTALYSADYSATLASRSSDAEPMLARVVGKHCESGDIVVKDEFLPADLAPGDLIAVPGTGAYCRSLSSNYNHVPRPPVIAVKDGKARVIVRRETEADLLALDV